MLHIETAIGRWERTSREGVLEEEGLRSELEAGSTGEKERAGERRRTGEQENGRKRGLSVAKRV